MRIIMGLIFIFIGCEEHSECESELREKYPECFKSWNRSRPDCACGKVERGLIRNVSVSYPRHSYNAQGATEGECTCITLQYW